MKKLLFIVFLINTSIAWAQSGSSMDKPDWWKSGKAVVKADTDSTQSAPEKPIKESFKIDSAYLEYIKSCCFLLKQDYSLYDKRKKKFYGYNDQGKFGSTYSIGIKCKGFNIISDEAVFPWEYDAKYPSFKSNKLTPTVTSSRYASLTDSVSLNYTILDSPIAPSTTIKDGFLYTSDPFTSTQDGLTINDSDTCKVGALLWIYKDGDLSDDNVKFSFMTTYITLDMVGNVDITAPDKSKECMACLLITYDEKEPVNYYLTGIGTQKENKWSLCFPFKGFKLNKENKQAKVEESGRLTEIKQFD